MPRRRRTTAPNSRELWSRFCAGSTGGLRTAESGGEGIASLAATSGDDRAAGPSAHAQPESVYTRPAAVVRLKRPLALGHGRLSLKYGAHGCARHNIGCLWWAVVSPFAKPTCLALPRGTRWRAAAQRRPNQTTDRMPGRSNRWSTDNRGVIRCPALHGSALELLTGPGSEFVVSSTGSHSTGATHSGTTYAGGIPCPRLPRSHRSRDRHDSRYHTCGRTCEWSIHTCGYLCGTTSGMVRLVHFPTSSPTAGHRHAGRRGRPAGPDSWSNDL